MQQTRTCFVDNVCVEQRELTKTINIGSDREKKTVNTSISTASFVLSPAEIAIHIFLDELRCSIWVVAEQGVQGHHKPRSAEAALRPVHLSDTLLYWMQALKMGLYFFMRICMCFILKETNSHVVTSLIHVFNVI